MQVFPGSASLHCPEARHSNRAWPLKPAGESAETLFTSPTFPWVTLEKQAQALPRQVPGLIQSTDRPGQVTSGVGVGIGVGVGVGVGVGEAKLSQVPPDGL